MGPYLYHREKVYSDVDTYNPDHKKFPLYRHAHVIEENIMPGETLFVPTGWWHTVDILETPTISLSATSFVRGLFHVPKPCSHRLLRVIGNLCQVPCIEERHGRTFVSMVVQ